MRLNVSSSAAGTSSGTGGEEVTGSIDTGNSDVEQLLESLGFTPSDHLDGKRIPKRFLHPSQVRGIDFDYELYLGE